MRLWRRLTGEEEPGSEDMDTTVDAPAEGAVAPTEQAGDLEIPAGPEPHAEPPASLEPVMPPPPDELIEETDALAVETTADESPSEMGAGGAPAAAALELDDQPVPDDPAVLEPRFEEGLERSRSGFMSRLRGFLTGSMVDPATWEEVEETLIAGDVGGALAMDVVERARERRDATTAEAAVRAELAARLVAREPGWAPAPAVDGGPAVILVVGVNGTGKTTTIGKLAQRYRSDGQRVILAAADTFRAAAIDQLRVWADRTGSELVAHAPGADPGAVVFDAIDAALARRADVVIADTAGRLHTKSNLMDELAKIRRVVDRRLPGARPETIFVLDATTGQNGLAQAIAFNEAVGLTGIVLTKLDSTAKGGIVFAIESTLGVPVRFVGVGERVSDLLPFEPAPFVEALFAD
jgi:fused signal recognition particle receptor